MFVKVKGQQQEEVHTKPEVNVRKQGRSTPVRTKVQRFEKLAREPEVGKSLRKVRKMKDKPGEGIQSSIKKFLQKVEKLEGPSSNQAKGEPKVMDPKGPAIPDTDGASTKPRLASLRSALSRRSSPNQGPLPKGGGKKGKGRVREGKGSIRTLEKWLLPLGSPAGHPDLENTDREGEGETRLDDQGGGQKGGQR